MIFKNFVHRWLVLVKIDLCTEVLVLCFSVKQQAKMAAHCRNIFGDMLLVEPLEGYVVSCEEAIFYVLSINSKTRLYV